MRAFAIPEHIKSILSVLEENGYRAFLVGGCVRDMLMGRPAHDWDIATGAQCQEVASLFSKSVPTGEKFGTMTVISDGGHAEVTTFRRDGEYTDGRKPESVDFVSELSEDLARRDFTINAMAMSLSGELTDMFGGQADIENKIIRCVGEPEARFSEDALRMLRAYRFSAVLGFEIDRKTLAAIKKCAAQALLLSAERVAAELERILVSKRPEVLGEMIKNGLLGGFLMTKEVFGLESLALLPREKGLRWCALCAVLCKQGLIDEAEPFLSKLRFERKTVRHASKGAQIALSGLPSKKTDIKRLLAKEGKDAVMCAAAAAETLGQSGRLALVNGILESGECYDIKHLAVNGNELIAAGCARGKETGRALGALLEHVIENPQDNEKGRLLEIYQGWRKEKNI